MRIVGGAFRGRKLVSPEGETTRPTSDRTRESVFNILRLDIFDAHVLDAFSGSGAMALEAISRGAKSAVCCDCDKLAQRAIQANILACRAQDAVRLYPASWQSALPKWKEAFDIVFLDPPYRMKEAYGEVLSVLSRAKLWKDDTIAVLEYASGDAVPSLPEGFVITDTRKYGAASVAFVRNKAF